MSVRSPNGRLARWSLQLQEHTFEIVHRSGRKHNDCDALSRAPVEPPNDETTDSEILPLLAVEEADIPALQREDPYMSAIIRHLEDPNSTAPRNVVRAARCFAMRNNTLFRRVKLDEGWTYALVLPKALRCEVIATLHDDPLSGHLAESKTWERI